MQNCVFVVCNYKHDYCGIFASGQKPTHLFQIHKKNLRKMQFGVFACPELFHKNRNEISQDKP
jgi:hypothetical protein